VFLPVFFFTCELHNQDQQLIISTCKFGNGFGLTSLNSSVSRYGIIVEFDMDLPFHKVGLV
jgi:hypothetical protein